MRTRTVKRMVVKAILFGIVMVVVGVLFSLIPFSINTITVPKSIQVLLASIAVIYGGCVILAATKGWRAWRQRNIFRRILGI